MTKLYKAVDSVDGKMSVWFVKGKFVAMSSYELGDAGEIKRCKEMDRRDRFVFEGLSRFADAIDPVLIAEW